MRKAKYVFMVIFIVFLVTSCSRKITVEFDTNGGEPLGTLTMKANDGIINDTLPTPIKDGYEFTGWYLNASLTNEYIQKETKVKKRLKLYASYKPITFSLTFESNGGSEIDVIEIYYGQKLSNLPTPYKEGNKFISWCTDIDLQNSINLNISFTKNTKLYAKWMQTAYKIIYNAQGGSPVLNSNYNYQDPISLPTPPTKEGYLFAGWYTNINCTENFEETVMPSQDVYLYAKWDNNNYNIHFITNSDQKITPINYTVGAAINLPTPVNAGHEFAGWYKSNTYDTLFEETVMPSQDVYLYAKWDEKTYNIYVTFLATNETWTYPFKYNELINIPKETIEGYTFKGIYYNVTYDSLFAIKNMPHYDLYTYAKYEINTYDISFVCPLGTTYSKLSFIFNQTINLKSINTFHDGYIFDGFYLDNEFKTPFDMVNMPSRNIILYLNYKFKEYEIKYVNQFSENIITMVEYSTNIELITPTKQDGYTFAGWCLDETLQILCTVEKMPSHNITLYAKWNYNLYELSFDADGGNVIESMIIPFNSPITLDDIPTKTGHKFMHFVDELGQIYELTTMPHRNLRLKVVWQVNTYIIEYRTSIGYSFEPLNIKYDELITYENPNQFIHYKFDNYYLDMGYTKVFSLEKMPDYNVVLYMKYLSIDLEFTKTENGYYVSRGNCNLDNVVIPSTYLNEPVIGISKEGFKDFTSLKTIVIPYTITDVKEGAFYNCYNLESIRLANVNQINDNSFNGCSRLREVIIGGIVERIGKNAFKDCVSLKAFSFSPFILKIDEYAFYNSGLENVKIEGNLQSIEKYAFSNCVDLQSFNILKTSINMLKDGVLKNSTRLSNIILPTIFEYESNCLSNTAIGSINISKYTTSIDFSAFADCIMLQSVNIEEENPDFKSNDGIIYSSDFKTILFVPTNKSFGDLGNYTIAPTVIRINDYAFMNSKNLKTLYVFTDLLSIGYKAFMNCENLAAVVIMADLEEIKDFAFENCQKLNSITIGVNNQYFSSENGVLYNKEKSVLLKYPASLENESFTIPASVNAVAPYAFSGNKFIKEISFSNVEVIDKYAFSGCTNLESVKNLNSLSLLEEAAFIDCVKLNNVLLPNGLKVISDYAFKNCSSLQEITHGDYIDVIGKYAFSDCTSLINFTAFNKTALFDEGSFRNTGLTQITFTDSTITIGGYAFSDLNMLTSIIIATNVEEIGSKAFINCPRLELFNVLSNNVYYTSIGGVLYDKALTRLIQYPASKSNTTYTLQLVTEIDDYAFYNAIKLVTVNLPQTLKVIGDYSFYSCSNLVNIKFPFSLEIIGQYAFAQCVKLNDLNIFFGINEIRGYAFENTNMNLTLNGFSHCYLPENFSYSWLLNMNGDVIYNEFKTKITIIYNDNKYVLRLWYAEQFDISSINLPAVTLYVGEEKTTSYQSTIVPYDDIILYAFKS